jgi:hypothetical protein
MSAAVSPNMMHAWCEPRETRQLQVAHFRRKARVYFDKLSSVAPRRPRLPASGRHAMLVHRKKGQGSERIFARAFPQKLAQSLHQTTRFLGVFLGVTVI